MISKRTIRDIEHFAKQYLKIKKEAPAFPTGCDETTRKLVELEHEIMKRWCRENNPVAELLFSLLEDRARADYETLAVKAGALLEIMNNSRGPA